MRENARCMYICLFAFSHTHTHTWELAKCDIYNLWDIIAHFTTLYWRPIKRAKDFIVYVEKFDIDKCIYMRDIQICEPFLMRANNLTAKTYSALYCWWKYRIWWKLCIRNYVIFNVDFNICFNVKNMFVYILKLNTTILYIVYWWEAGEVWCRGKPIFVLRTRNCLYANRFFFYLTQNARLIVGRDVALKQTKNVAKVEIKLKFNCIFYVICTTYILHIYICLLHRSENSIYINVRTNKIRVCALIWVRSCGAKIFSVRSNLKFKRKFANLYTISATLFLCWVIFIYYVVIKTPPRKVFIYSPTNANLIRSDADFDVTFLKWVTFNLGCCWSVVNVYIFAFMFLHLNI